MTKENINNFIGSWVEILFSVIAVLAIKSIFDDDSSKIVSKKGRQFLSDERKMSEINEKIIYSEGENQYSEVVI